VALVLSAVILVAGLYRWAVFGDLNSVHGGGGKTSSTATGASEFLRPSIAEVEQSAKSEASAEGRLRNLSCRELPGNTWSCALHFVGGSTVTYHGVWNYTRGTVVWSGR
jgi:hypothetical protein